jgi:hypothetical protein
MGSDGRLEADGHEIWLSVGDGTRLRIGDTWPSSEDHAARLVACWNACAGMVDPAAEIEAMRKSITHLASTGRPGWTEHPAGDHETSSSGPAGEPPKENLERAPSAVAAGEPTRMIQVKMPKSLWDIIRSDAALSDQTNREHIVETLKAGVNYRARRHDGPASLEAGATPDWERDFDATFTMAAGYVHLNRERYCPAATLDDVKSFIRSLLRPVPARQEREAEGNTTN